MSSATNGAGLRDKVQFDANTPTFLTLDHSDGKPAAGRFGERELERAEGRRARRELAEDRTPPAPARRSTPERCPCDLCHSATWRARHTATAARAARGHQQ